MRDTMRATFGRTIAVFLPLAALLGGCGGGDDSPALRSVGGSVSGLSGTGLILQNNATDDLAVAANGPFAFSKTISQGSPYAVTVKTQPTAQACTVTKGSGKVGGTKVTDIAVACVTKTQHHAYVSHFNDTGIEVLYIEADGGLAPVPGSPFSSGLSTDESIYQLALNPSHTFLAAAASGGSSSGTNNHIVVFAIDAASGELTPVAGSPFLVAADSGTEALTFDKTGAYLYAANYNVGTVAAYSFNATTGALTAVPGSPFAVGMKPTIISVDPSNKFVLTTTVTSPGVSVLAINSANGALTQVVGSPFPITAGGFPIGAAFGAGGRFFYVADVPVDSNGVLDFSGTAGTVSGFSLNPTTGVLVALGSSPAAIATNGFISADAAGEFLYVPVLDGLSSYSVNSTTGALTLVAGSPYPAGANPSDVSAEPSGQFVYLTNTDDGTVSGFTIAPGTGLLTAVPGSPVAAGGSAGDYNIVTD